jgi:hypothetical protein
MKLLKKTLLLFGGDIAYALRDLFTAALAAGSVNGTTAEPTGQTRTVTDTNNKLSITSGVLNFATGGAGAGDPGLWYPAQTTVLGTVLLGNITPGSTSPAGSIGWDTAAAGIIQDCLSLITGSVLQAVAAGTGVSVGTFTNGSTYTIIIIPRANGFWFLIKGGSEYPTTKMVWLNTVGAAGSWLAAVGVSTGTIGIFTVDNMRVPQSLYIPSPLAYDTFTRANGALGSTEATGPDGQNLSALAWAFTTGIWTISTNAAIATPVSGAETIVNGSFGSDTAWTKGAGWAIASGTANATTASSDLSQTTPPLTVGVWYNSIYTISGFAAGTVQAVIGGVAMPTHGSNSGFSEIALAGTTDFLMRGAGFTGSLDNISVKPLPLADLFSSVQVSTADVIADVGLTIGSATTGGKPVGLVLNLDSTSNPQNFILCYHDGKGNIVLQECVAGTYGAAKFTTAVTYSAGAVLRVIRDGTSCRVFYNNAAVSTVQTMTANTNTKHGLFSTHSANSMDGFTLWNRGVDGSYSTLDQY